jgi:Fe-S-cluster containining protein
MCCTAGWPIPVEQVRQPLIQQAIQHNVIPLRAQPWLTPAPDAPEEFAGTLALRDNGHCVFFEAGRPGCAIHDLKPAACVHFPYVCLIDQRGVRVTLSHYCPTAASLLFEHEGPIEIVEGPSPVPALEIPEGLDARESLPPLREPNRLMSFDEFSNWERDELRTLKSMAGESEFANVIERFLAAKLFASWAAYQGDGTTAVRHAVRAAHAVLQEEMTRAAQDAGRRIDAALLTHAIRQADLRLVHRRA